MQFQCFISQLESFQGFQTHCKQPELRFFDDESQKISEYIDLLGEYSNGEYSRSDKEERISEYFDTSACLSNAPSMIELPDTQDLSKTSSNFSQEQSAKKTHTTSQCLREQGEDSYEPSRKQKKINKKKTPEKSEKNSYPTKNFLVQFKKIHIQQIVNVFGQEIFQTYPWLFQIDDKHGINMKDYQKIYSVPQFQKLFQDFFASNELYRSLMTSRCDAIQKKNYILKLFRFQEAFKNRKFDRIN